MQSVANPNAPAADIGDLLLLLRHSYAIGDGFDRERAQRTVSNVLYDMMAEVHPAYLRGAEQSALVADIVERWDSTGILVDAMNMIIKSHRRSFVQLTAMIVDRFLSISRNRIFLDTSEIVPLLAVSCGIGLEIRRLLPETTAVWLEEIES